MIKGAGILLLLIFLVGCAAQEKVIKPKEFIKTEEVKPMKLTSSAFEHNGKIPSKHTCDGEDLIPPLTIEDVPAEAKTLVLIMDDPDAVKPAGKVWDHWVIFNIPPKTTEIEEGKDPNGVKGKNSWKKLGYGSPCPPDTEHRYFFKLYALDTELDLGAGATKRDLEEAMKGHVLKKAELVGKYRRS